MTRSETLQLAIKLLPNVTGHHMAYVHDGYPCIFDGIQFMACSAIHYIRPWSQDHDSSHPSGEISPLCTLEAANDVWGMPRKMIAALILKYWGKTKWPTFWRQNFIFFANYGDSPLFPHCEIWISMMTSSNGNIFRVTGPLWGEFTGHRWIPLIKANDAELWCFLWSVPEPTVEQTMKILVIWDAITLIMT